MDILSKIKRKLHRTFCKHEWQFEEATHTRQDWPKNAAFIYICEKCGSHKAINCDDIEAKIKEFGEKDNYDYDVETVLLTNGYGPYNVSYTGRDVGRAVQWYWKHEGVLISAYANQIGIHYGEIPDYRVK